MSLVKLAFPPGVARRGTEYEVMGRWFDAGLARWWEGVLGPIGGWLVRTDAAMTGKPRAMITWRDNANTRWIVVGTHSNLYALSETQTTPSNITPAGFTSGQADATLVGGYGQGPYGEGLYGTPRLDISSIQDASMWTMDTFGQDWYGAAAWTGLIYRWQRNIGVPAAALGGTAPTADAIVVTPERFLFALAAAGNRRRVQWADQESDSVWTPSATNQAGDFDLATQGRLMCGKAGNAATLLWTDVDVHVAQFIGRPFIYSIRRAGNNCGIISRGAAAATDTFWAWMGINGFFMYDGVTRPIPCDLYDYVYSDINLTQRSKIVAVQNAQFNEIAWRYPSAASIEIDRAVVWNYLEGHWRPETDPVRLSGYDRGVFNNPLMAGNDGFLYDHETGSNYDGATPFVESGPLEIGEGDNIMGIREIVPDERTQGSVLLRLKMRDAPNGVETTFGPYTPADFISLDDRPNGRQGKIRVEFQSSSARWGIPRADVVQLGRR